MIEIERKFLVKDLTCIEQATKHSIIKQGFLSADPERVVRVRLKNNIGYITVKGKSSKDSLERFEWEKEISKTEANALLKLCLPAIIEKTRYEIPIANHVFEVDVFKRKNKGLIVAEIELEHVNQHFTKPNWLGKEVTGNVKYYNSELSKNPYINWKNNINND